MLHSQLVTCFLFPKIQRPTDHLPKILIRNPFRKGFNVRVAAVIEVERQEDRMLYSYLG